MKKFIKVFISILIIAVFVAGYFYLRRYRSAGRDLKVRTWLQDSKAHTDWAYQPNTRCENAPFLIPTYGFIGYLWNDSFYPGHRHQGIDIFGGDEPGKIPVFAAYDGYLTRFPDWKSSVIIRIPDDPFQPGRQIWAYYTHMADPQGKSFIVEEFPAGTEEKFIKAGTLLGYQGNFSGKVNAPVGVHLHLSIVLSGSDGHFLNELDIKNTLDPSPYFQLPLNATAGGAGVSRCQVQEENRNGF